MKYVLAFLLLMMLAGAAYAADQPNDANVTPAVVYTNADSGNNTAPATPPAEEDQNQKKRTVFALTAGMYTPNDSLTKGVFGDHFLRLGIRPLPTNAPHGWRFAYDVNYIGLTSITEGTLSTNKATLIPITAGFLRRFGKDKVKSYAAINVGPYYGNAKIPDAHIKESGWGWDANLTLGTVFNEQFCIEARYDMMSKFAHLDFSSLSVSVAMKIFTAKL